MTNEYGLDVSYFKEKLGLIIRDCARYTPEEMARSLETYRNVAINQGVHHAQEKLNKARDLEVELLSGTMPNTN